MQGGRVISTYGTTTWSGATSVNTNDFFTGPATFNNFGTFVDSNAFSTVIRDWYAGDAMVFNNIVTYRKAGATTSRLEWVFNNAGTLELDAGTVVLNRGGTGTGVFDLAGATTLELAGGDNAWVDTVTLFGAGRVLLSAGTLRMDGDIASARFDVTGGALTGAGTVTLTGTGSQWTAGFMTGGGTTRIAAGADLTVSGGNRKYLGTRTLDVEGTLIEASSGDLVDFEGAARLEISGVMDIRTDTSWQNYSGAVGTLTIHNTGVLKKTVGAGQFEFLNTTLDSTGLIDVQSGDLGLGGGTSSGEFRAAAGSEVALLYGMQTWVDGASGTGEGAIALRNLSGSTGGTLSVTGVGASIVHLNLGHLGTLTGTGTVTLTGTDSQWTAGFMTGGGNRKYLGTRTLDVQGTLIEASSGDLVDFEGAARLEISGVMDIRSDRVWQNFSGAVGTLTIHNSGTLQKSAGTGQFAFRNTSLDNEGALGVLTGMLRFPDPVVQGGTVSVANGATLILGSQTILGPFPVPTAPAMLPVAPVAPAQQTAFFAAPTAAVPDSIVTSHPLAGVLPSTAFAASASDKRLAEREIPKRILAPTLIGGDTLVHWRMDIRSALASFRLDGRGLR